MSDLKRKLDALDDVAASDVWRDATTRVPRRNLDEQPRSRHRVLTAVVALGLSGTAAAFAFAAFRSGPTGVHVEAAPSGQQYEAAVLVIDTPPDGPVMCTGLVLDSLPPQCAAEMPLDGWSWSEVEGEESAQDSTWGWYEIVGVFDGDRFAVLSATTPSKQDFDSEDAPIQTPCPVPEGGWPTPNPARSSDEDMRAAIALVRDDSHFAGAWTHDGVLTAAFTDDPTGHETTLLGRWGGPLCLVQHERSLSELESLQADASQFAEARLDLHVVSSSVHEVYDRVDLEILVVPTGSEDQLRERYGDGVQVEPLFQPVT